MATWNQKEQEELEYRIKLIKNFLDKWDRYDQLLQKSYREKNNTSEEEEEFLKLKSQVARSHQYLMEYLGPEYVRPEPITPFLSSTVTLDNMKDIQFDFFKKLRLQWHATMLRLNEALGYLMTHLELQVPLDD